MGKDWEKILDWKSAGFKTKKEYDDMRKFVNKEIDAGRDPRFLEPVGRNKGWYRRFNRTDYRLYDSSLSEDKIKKVKEKLKKDFKVSIVKNKIGDEILYELYHRRKGTERMFPSIDNPDFDYRKYS